MAAGDLDTSFAGTGKKTISFGGADSANAVLVQPNGRILVAGNGALPSGFCVARLRSNGLLDTTFGSDGKRVIRFGGEQEGAFGAALQPDGKLVLVGDSDFRVAVARLKPNGTLDPTFSGDGRKTFSWGPIGRAEDVLVLPNGKLLVAGFSGPETGNVQLARLNANGALDSTFGTGGIATADFGGDDFGLAMARQANGRILVAGLSRPTEVGATTATEVGATTGGAVVARFRANGLLDPDFDGDGRLMFGTGSVRAVLVQPDRRIVVAGNANGSQTMTVTRLRPNGSPDTTFDGDGTATIDFGSLADAGNDAVLQPDGKIVVAGYTQAVNSPTAVARLNPDGSLDGTFGAGGKVTINFDAAMFGNAVALQANGRILVAGQRAGNEVFAVARLRG
jgi:uncharacterized delta-60 repeat protein